MKRFSVSFLAISLLSVFCAVSKNFFEEAFTVVNPLDGTVLNGTLSQPVDRAPRAIVVLATGSGLQDRDETIGMHKPFRELAQYLAENGYAVARTDDRGWGNPPDTALLNSSTPWDEVADYRAVLAAMKLRPELKGLRGGILGHSLGGTEAIMTFSKDKKAKKYNSIGATPDFIITLAGAMLPGDSLVLSQVKVMAEMQNVPSQFDALAPKLRHRYNLVKSKITREELRQELYEDVTADIPGFMLTDALEQRINAEIESMISPAYREMLRYDPGRDIGRVNVPWLALFGSKDLQVVAEPNIDYLNKHKKGKKVTVTLLDGKNHLFQNAITGMPAEYDMIPEEISEDTLQEILEWLEMTI